MSIDDDAVRCTEKLVSRAVDDSSNYPCLWLRGLMPKILLNKMPKPTDQLQISFTNPSLVQWTSGTYYGDASGGVHSQYNDLRRCGCSVVSCTDEGQLIFGADFPLVGDVQTVPRGELYCIVFLIDNADEMATINYITDNQKVSETYNQGPVAGARSANCDLFLHLFRTCIEKRITLTVRWMPSHLKLSDPRPRNK